MKGVVADGVALVLHPEDTVATALSRLSVGQTVSFEDVAWELRAGQTVILEEDVPIFHTVALCRHEMGSDVRKYGEVIGQTTSGVAAGEWVHTHNCRSYRGRGDLEMAGKETR